MFEFFDKGQAEPIVERLVKLPQDQRFRISSSAIFIQDFFNLIEATFINTRTQPATFIFRFEFPEYLPHLDHQLMRICEDSDLNYEKSVVFETSRNKFEKVAAVLTPFLKEHVMQEHLAKPERLFRSVEIKRCNDLRGCVELEVHFRVDASLFEDDPEPMIRIRRKARDVSKTVPLQQEIR